MSAGESSLELHRGGTPASETSPSTWTLFVKRSIDLGLGFWIMLVALPLIVGGIVAILLDDGFPIFFRQKRAGLHGRAFDILKLRTLKHGNTLQVDEGHQVRGEHPLLTRVGGFLRRFKIDELPQIFNVMKGDMSLVGPRPATIEQAAEYGPFERRRLLVKPGMTGWAQINGNIAYTWAERFLLDVWYIDHLSNWKDFCILNRTWAVVFFGESEKRKNLEEARAYAKRTYRHG